jgi:hypothetical protein
MKTIQKTLLATLAGCALALAAGNAMSQAAPVQCSTITSIRAWADLLAGCDIGDKNWTLMSEDETLLPATIAFSLNGGIYNMQITGFDNSDAAGAWELGYTISVLDPTQHISAMAAGADNPGGGQPGLGSSLLTKDVTGDAGGPFTLTVVNGAITASSVKLGLNAPSLTVAESFSVTAGGVLNSVSDTFFQRPNLQVPEPGSLLLLAAGFGAAGWFGRRRDKRA